VVVGLALLVMAPGHADAGRRRPSTSTSTAPVCQAEAKALGAAGKGYISARTTGARVPALRPVQRQAGAPGPARALLRCVLVNDVAAPVRAEAARRLGQVIDVAAAGVLVAATGDAFVEVGEAATRALATLGEPALAPVTAELRMATPATQLRRLLRVAGAIGPTVRDGGPDVAAALAGLMRAALAPGADIPAHVVEATLEAAGQVAPAALHGEVEQVVVAVLDGGWGRAVGALRAGARALELAGEAADARLLARLALDRDAVTAGLARRALTARGLEPPDASLDPQLELVEVDGGAARRDGARGGCGCAVGDREAGRTWAAGAVLVLLGLAIAGRSARRTRRRQRSTPRSAPRTGSASRR